MMANLGPIKFGTIKLGTQQRAVSCTASTLKGVEWEPNFRASQRGCALKTTNEALIGYRIAKKSQIEAINGTVVTQMMHKKIKKMLDEHIKSPGTEFTVTFMTVCKL